jgi:hypothetical protein
MSDTDPLNAFALFACEVRFRLFRPPPLQFLLLVLALSTAATEMSTEEEVPYKPLLVWLKANRYLFKIQQRLVSHGRLHPVPRRHFRDGRLCKFPNCE